MNEKMSINSRYNARLLKVLEITRQKPVFPTEILRIVFDFAKSMEIGEKIELEEIEEMRARLLSSLNCACFDLLFVLPDR